MVSRCASIVGTCFLRMGSDPTNAKCSSTRRTWPSPISRDRFGWDGVIVCHSMALRPRRGIRDVGAGRFRLGHDWPVRSSDAKLRRAQALALSSGAALRITRELISQKLAGQERVARNNLLDDATAHKIARFRNEIPTSHCIATIRLIEAQAASAYWSAWRTLPMSFPKNDLPRVPQHWLTFGTRISPLTGSAPLAANPANAILNYLYAVLESECRLAAAALGLIPVWAFYTWIRPIVTVSPAISWSQPVHRLTPTY